MFRFLFCSLFFFFNDTATTEIYTLSLHDALPISAGARTAGCGLRLAAGDRKPVESRFWGGSESGRSEEHTSELQSRSDLVCRLLLEKKKKKKKSNRHQTIKCISTIQRLNV